MVGYSGSGSCGLAAMATDAWKNGSLKENQQWAKEAFQSARENRELKEDSVEHFDVAIMHWNIAFQKPGLTELDKAILKLNLGKAHGLRAIATFACPLSNALQDRHLIACHHQQAAAQNLKEYRLQAQQMNLPDAFGKLNKLSNDFIAQCLDVNNIGDRISLAKGMEVHLLGGELSSTYTGPRLPHARMQLYIAQQYFQFALKSLENNMELGPPLEEIDKLTQHLQPGWRMKPKDDSLTPALGGWKACLQKANDSSQALYKAAMHLRHEASESEDKRQLLTLHNELAEQVQFLLQRGRVLMDLAWCAEDLYRLTKGSEEFDFQGSLDLCDSLRDAHKKAADFQAHGENMLTSSGADVEMECVVMHYLALVFGCMCLTALCRDMHKQCVLKALSLDPTATEYDSPTAALRQRRWFMKSQQHLLSAQNQDRAAAERERNNQLEEIREDLEKIKQARDEGLKPFLRYVFANHPPKTGGKVDACVNQDAPLSRIKFLKMHAHYHPDKMPPNAKTSVKLLHEEIFKHLNHCFESTYKNQ